LDGRFKNTDRSDSHGRRVYLAIPCLSELEPSNAKVMAPESSARVDVAHPRRAKLAQRLASNATPEAFEEIDLFAKVSGYLSEVRVDIGNHVKSGQILAVSVLGEVSHFVESQVRIEPHGSIPQRRHHTDGGCS
jgi:hypothetical protein